MEQGVSRALSWGFPRHPKVKFKDNQKPKLGDAPEGIPSFAFVYRSLYLGLYFYSPHDMCFAWSVLYDLSLCFLVYHNHPCCTHLLIETHMIRNLLEYSMCFTYIF